MNFKFCLQPSEAPLMRICAKMRCFSSLLLVLALAGCQSAGPDMMFHGLAEKAGMATPEVQPKDFVKKHQTADGKYMSVGVTPPSGKVAIRDPKGVTNLQKELEGAQKKAEDSAQ
jgi:hypothetical protein